MNIPRPEYPRPQFVRPDWLCLNGEWQFEIDNGDSGEARGLRGSELKDRILLPFCPESTLSGIGNTDFMNAVWYRRQVLVPDTWAEKRVLLHFQAVDYDATVWVNGTEVARHRGGFTPFTADLGGVAEGGQEITIVVRARDSRTTPQPRGKQSQRYENHSCLYTRTTGIWQTVWLEPVPHTTLLRPRLTPDVANSRIYLEQGIRNARPGLKIRAILSDANGEVCRCEAETGLDFQPRLDLDIPADKRRLWSPSDPHLYDLAIELLDEKGEVIDHATTYAGLRGVMLDGKAIRVNGEVIFQRLVLDQGYYPDGIMTAPMDEDLVKDIQLSMAAGFNGVRLHQKVFEERFLYHADRMGYLCWGEFPDWGCRYGTVDNNAQHHAITYAAQWSEAVARDYSHPCIVGWCALNETYQEIKGEITELDDATHALLQIAKGMDTTRPVLDASGYSHRVLETDVYDSHDYEQDPEKFRANQAGLAQNKPMINGPAERPWNTPYRGQPYFVSEFGGIWWNELAKTEKDSWGYGTRPRTLEEFYERFAGLCAVLLDDPNMFGYCYTQLTDVFLEENGIFGFDRKAKFDLERIRGVQERVAAIEKTGVNGPIPTAQG